MHYTTDIASLPAVDVAVAGGGIAGTFAALGAAGEGATVALIEEHSFLGGQGTAGGVHTFCGETRVVNDDWRRMLARLRELDGLAEYRPNADGRAFETETLKFVLQEMILEAGIRLYLHTRLVDALSAGGEAGRDGERGDGRRIDGLVIQNKSGLQYLPAAQFIDATGDADIVARSGLAFQKGGKALRPGATPILDESQGLKQLPMSLYFTLVDEGIAQEPVLPPRCPTFADDEDLPMVTLSPRGRLMAVKMKVIGHDVTDGSSLSAAEIDARRQMMGVIYHLQSKGYRGRTYETYRLAHVSPHIGIREGRRVVARHVLSVDDALAGRHHEDAVAVGSYHVDYHWPNVVQRAGTGVTTQCPPYQIPLSAMRPRDCDNLLVPGRCMSGEQMAMSSFRVMGTCAQTGFAAGVSAALARVDAAGSAPPRPGAAHPVGPTAAARRGSASGAGASAGLDALDVRVVQKRLRERGVRLDLAPYGNYLRFRRGIRESIPLPQDQRPVAFAVTLLPSGGVLAAVAAAPADLADPRGDSTLAVLLFRRWEESWQPTRSFETPEAVRSSAVRLSFRLDAPWRLSAGDFERVDTPREPSDDGTISLDLTVASGSFTDARRRSAESGDAGVSWSDWSVVASDSDPDLEVELELCSGDPAKRLQAQSSIGSITVSTEEGVRRPVSSLDIGPASPAPGLASDSTGLLAVYQAADGETVFARVPVDALPLSKETETEPMAGDWHHDDRSWIELLREPTGERR